MRRPDDGGGPPAFRWATEPKLGKLVDERIDSHRVAALHVRLKGHQEAERIRPDVAFCRSPTSLTRLGFAGGFVALAIFGPERADVEHEMRDVSRALMQGTVAAPAAGAAR